MISARSLSKRSGCCLLLVAAGCVPAQAPPAAVTAGTPSARTYQESLVGGGAPPAAPSAPLAATSVFVPQRQKINEETQVISDDSQDDATLAAISCAELERSAAEEQQRAILEMRRAIHDEFSQWRQEQPDCWQQWQRNHLWGDAIGDSYGAGGLGLSGIGEGGGGRGEGIGLGSIGTLGHGAGTGQGFGSGHGRLGGSHATRAPRIRMGATMSTSSPHAVSGTNNQVQDVDEADIVKTDGDYVYLAVNGALRIVAAAQPRLISVTKLPGQVREMFVEGERAAVYVALGHADQPRCTYGYDCQFTGDGTQTALLVYDLKNRANPLLVRRIDFSGSLLSSRRVDSMVHTVVTTGDPRQQPSYATWPPDLPRCGVYESAVRAQLRRLETENERQIRQAMQLRLPTITENGVERSLCDAVYRVRGAAAGRGTGAFTSIVSMDLSKVRLPVHAATLHSNPGAVFATADSVYLAVRRDRAGAHSAYPSGDEWTDLHRFSVGKSPEMTRYRGSGSVPGHVLNQFSMDEWSGNLRIATTRGRVPDPHVESLVSILTPVADGGLVRAGAVEHLAPGEDIRSVRFDGDRGYVVTFKKTDPLFVLDLKQPRAPRVLGELEIPGFSTYMHRIDDSHLLSIGFDANDHGSFAYFDGLILQLFEVSDPLRPRLLFKEKIGTRGSSSEAATNHLAFNYFSEQGLLAVPMTVCEGGGDGINGNHLVFGGLMIYKISAESGFRYLGGVNHGTKGQTCNTWWSNANSGVKRSVFVDDLVFSIATDRVKVQNLRALGRDLADIRLL